MAVEHSKIFNFLNSCWISCERSITQFIKTSDYQVEPVDHWKYAVN